MQCTTSHLNGINEYYVASSWTEGGFYRVGKSIHTAQNCRTRVSAKSYFLCHYLYLFIPPMPDFGFGKGSEQER